MSEEADKLYDTRYELGYEEGQRSGYADWASTFDEIVPDDVDAWKPSKVGRYVEKIVSELEWWRTFANKIDPDSPWKPDTSRLWLGERFRVEQLHRDYTCALCGHDTSVDVCGYGAAHDDDGNWVHLCHADDHSCYHRWTVCGDRPKT